MKLNSTPALSVRTGLQAGGFNSCMTYCDQQRIACDSNPSIPNSTCADRYPVCQNACGVCATTPY